jgi:hypothetical protein
LSCSSQGRRSPCFKRGPPKIAIRARITASDLDSWWVCFFFSLAGSMHVDAPPRCSQSGTGVFRVSLSLQVPGPLLLRLWAQRGADGAPCESARASVLRPKWLSASAVPGRPEELLRAGSLRIRRRARVARRVRARAARVRQ